MKVYPPFTPCIRYAFKLFGFLYVFLFGAMAIARLVQGLPIVESVPSDLWILVALLLAIPTILALVVYIGARVWAWSFDQYGVKGRSYWGRRVEIRWPDVSDVRATSVEGIPALLIGSRSSKSEIFAYTLGVDLRKIHTQLVRRAGQDHVLTQCFDPVPA